MTNWFLVYLLGILDGVSSTLNAFAVLSGALFFVVSVFVPGFVRDFGDDEMDPAFKQRALATARLWRNRALVLFFVAAGISALLPTTESLMRAYVMVEGSGLVTAENAKAATDEIVKRVDTLIDALKKTP